MDDFDYDKFAEAQARALEKIQGRTIDVKQIEKELDRFKKSISSQVNDINKAQPTWKSLGQVLGGNTIAGKDFGYALKKVKSEIESYEDAIKKAAESATDAAGRAKVEQLESGKQEAIKTKKTLQSAAAIDVAKTSAANFGTGITKILTTSIIDGASQFVKGLQAGQDGIDLYSNAARAASKTTADSLNLLGDTAATAGPMLATLGPIGAAVGAGLFVFGNALKLVTGYAEKLAKEGIDILSTELSKTQKAFKDASSSGALFAEGMTGVRNAAHKAGLSTDQFAEVLKTQSANITASGLGMTEGIKRLGDVKTAMRKSGIEASLLNLGYGFKEQAELVAEVQANIARSGAGAGTTEQVARQTKEYAENLRLISNLTGEDAKSKMKQVQEQNQILAFQNKISSLSVDQRAQIDAAMANMSEADKKALRDRIINNGAVVNKEAALYEATNNGARRQNEALFNLYKQGNLSATTVAETQGQYADSIKSGARANQAAAVAAYNSGSEAAQSIAKSNLDGLNQTTKVNKDSVAAAKAALKGQESTTDPLTASVNKIETSAQTLKVSLEDELQPAIVKFADTLIKAQQQIVDKLKDLGLKEYSTGENIGRETGSLVGTGVGASAGLVLGGAAAAATGVGLIPGLAMMAAGLGLGAFGGHAAGEASGLGVSRMFGAGQEERKLAAGDFITRPTRAIVGEAGNEYVMPEKQLSGVAAKLYNDMADHMKLGEINAGAMLGKAPESMLGGIGAKLGSIASMIPGPIGAVASMGTSMFGDNSTKGGHDGLSDLIKEQNELMKQSMDKYDTMIAKMTETSYSTERLYHAMS